jgi:transposase InsO family protein
MKKTEITLRRQAIQLLLNGDSKASVAHRLGKSWFWVNYWSKRYQPDEPENSLQNRSSAPKHPHREWPEEVQRLVKNSRKARVEAEQPGYKYALIGAEAIHYELRELGILPVPPVRTIHHWLKTANMVPSRSPRTREEQPSKPYPAPANQAVNDLHELDLKGPFYLTGSDQKHYLCALRDASSKRVALAVICDKHMETIIDFLVSAWQKLGLPKVLQMDNGLEFRGSNRYPRSFGKLVRVCLDLEIQPLFIPPHEPWRNSVIENLNGLLDRIFLKSVTFKDFAYLQSSAAEVEKTINTAHRLASLSGKTPAEFARQVVLRLLPLDYDWRKRNLQLVKGKVSFIRLVRKSGRITLCANDKFEIGEEYQWQYVRATVDLDAHRLDVFLSDQLIKDFDFH